jgi:hypothetical protein
MLIARLLAISLFLVGCSNRAHLHGSWSLFAIDDLPVEEAFPSRFDAPAGTFGQIAIDPGEFWTETRITSSTLELLKPDVFRETRVSTSTISMTSDLARRLGGRRSIDGDPVRERLAPDTVVTVGYWKIEADSLLLFQTREQAEAGLAAEIAKLSPQITEGHAREAARAALANAAIPAKATGRLVGGRLYLQWVNGQSLQYRRDVQ